MCWRLWRAEGTFTTTRRCWRFVILAPDTKLHTYLLTYLQVEQRFVLYSLRSSNAATCEVPRTLHGTSSRYLGPLDRVADLHGRRALRSASSSRLVMPMFRLSTVGSRASTFLDLGSGMGCPKKLFRRRHFKVFDADFNPPFFTSHILILSSNC